MTVMEFINAHREDMEPCECVILPDGSVEEPQPSHIKKLEEISGEDKLTLNSRMEKNMEPIFFMVEYTGCMLIWSTRVVVPSHPTPAQEETLETLYFAAMLAPGYHREQVGETYEECVRKAKRTALERERQNGICTSSCSYRIFAVRRLQQDQGVRSQGQGAGYGQRGNHRPWRYVRRDRFLPGSQRSGDQADPGL